MNCRKCFGRMAGNGIVMLLLVGLSGCMALHTPEQIKAYPYLSAPSTYGLTVWRPLIPKTNGDAAEGGQGEPAASPGAFKEMPPPRPSPYAQPPGVPDTFEEIPLPPETPETGPGAVFPDTIDEFSPPAQPIPGPGQPLLPNTIEGIPPAGTSPFSEPLIPAPPATDPATPDTSAAPKAAEQPIRLSLGQEISLPARSSQLDGALEAERISSPPVGYDQTVRQCGRMVVVPFRK